MIPTALLQEFLQLLKANRLSEHHPPPLRLETNLDEVPSEVVQFLSQLGGWRYGDMHFTALSELEPERARFSSYAAEFEEGRSDRWGHAFFHPDFFPIACSSHELIAYDPTGHFGGVSGQVVTYDFKGDNRWLIFASLTSWLRAFVAALETGKNSEYEIYNWARKNQELTVMSLPEALAEQRSRSRFDAGLGPWIRLRHLDGSVWSIRERRDGYELELGEGEDAVRRRRTCARPSDEMERLIKEQRAEGFS